MARVVAVLVLVLAAGVAAAQSTETVGMITSTIAVKYSFMISEIRAGGSRSESVVNPRTSDISTETVRTSPPSRVPSRKTRARTSLLTYCPNSALRRRRARVLEPCR